MLPKQTYHHPRELTPEQRKRDMLSDARRARADAARLRARADDLEHEADLLEREANDCL